MLPTGEGSVKGLPLFGKMPITRRQMLCQAGTGMGLLGLAGLLAEAQEADRREAHPLAVRRAHHPPRAKRMIFLFMPGGPSQMDTFDPKPRISAESGKPIPLGVLGLTRVAPGKLLASPWKFKTPGQSGTHVSELFPNLPGRVDDLRVSRALA